MRLIIEGKTYGDFYDCVGAASLGDLRDLKRRTGVTAPSIKAAIKWSLDQLPKTSKEAESWDPLDLLDNDVFIENLIGAAWLSKRKAGEDVTIEEMEALPFSAIQLNFDDELAVIEKVADALPKEGLVPVEPRTKKPKKSS